MTDPEIRYRLHYSDPDGALVLLINASIAASVIAAGHELSAIRCIAYRHTGRLRRLSRVERRDDRGAWATVRWPVPSPEMSIGERGTPARPARGVMVWPDDFAPADWPVSVRTPSRHVLRQVTRSDSNG